MHTNLDLISIDHVPSNGTHSGSNAVLYVIEDNEAVIKVIIRGRSPTMRHVSRTHRVALDWLFDRINLGSKIQIRYIDTKHHFADISTQGNFTREPVRSPKITSGYKRSSRLISYMHHTCDYKNCCHVGNTAKQCRLGLFQDSDFAGDLEDLKSTSGGTLCIFGSHTFVPISWMCKKQTSVSHSSTESEIISLDTGLRLDGLPALELWDLIVSVFGNTYQSHKERRDPCTNKRKVRSTPHTNHKRKQSQRVINDLDNVDFIPSTVQSSHHEALLYVFEDNEAVIKMIIIKGRSPTMRHVSRTHRFALDRLFDRVNLDPKIEIKYVDTKNQLADLLTTACFTRDEWCHFLRLFNLMNFSTFSCSHFLWNRKQSTMAKRTLERKKDRRRPALAKPRSAGPGCFKRPRESRVGFEFCLWEHRSTCATQSPKPSNEFSRVAESETIRV